MTPRDLLFGRGGGRSAPRRDDCRRMQAILLDLADRRVPGPEAHAAIDHLETCRGCEAELASTTLILTALRRLADEVEAANPPEASWRQIVARIDRPQPHRVHVGNIAGALVGVALVVSVALPPILSMSYASPTLSNDVTRTDSPAESYQDSPKRLVVPSRGGLSYDRADLYAQPAGSVPARYPDNTKPAPGGVSGAQDQL